MTPRQELKRRTAPNNRRGVIAVLSAFMLVVVLVIAAFAMDVGMLYVSRVELQRSADASAIAAAWELIDDGALSGNGNMGIVEGEAREVAAQYAALNPVFRSALALSEEDTVVGYLSNPSDPDEAIDTSGDNRPNTVQVVVRRDDEINDSIPLFFAKIIGWDSVNVQARATACIESRISGFTVTSESGNLGMLPFALDQETWNALLASQTSDDWTWNSQLNTVSPGSDGIWECNLYPQSTGSPGNRGTVDIGSNNNSTADISRQITDGISAEDMEHHGGALEFDEHGVLKLNGDTGISAGVKDELASIIGEPKVLPVFSHVGGNGNNAMYTIVKFVGVRILEVKLTGSKNSKRVIVQPANIVLSGAIYSTTSGQSDYIYTPAWLTR